MGELYAPFVRTENPILFMDTRIAELTKYAANAMLATRISFMNDIALLCEKVGADVDAVRKGMGADKRIGYPFLFPGVGYGGSCFPKDVKALVATAREYGIEFDLLRAVERTNERQKRLAARRRRRSTTGDLAGKHFAVWGLAFKPKTDDMREAPSLVMHRGAARQGRDGRGARPGRARRSPSGTSAIASATPRRPTTRSRAPTRSSSSPSGTSSARPDFERMKKLMKQPVVFDGRNIFDPARMRERGFVYFGIGRP